MQFGHLIRNFQLFSINHAHILLSSLQLNTDNWVTATFIQYHSSFLDLLLKIDKDGRLRVKIYDKRDDFNFDIVNFPFLCGNVPQLPSYGVYISQLIRYARASTSYDEFLSRSCRLTSKLLRQGFERFKLISVFKIFYGRHKIFVDRYKVSVTHIISDLFLETLYRS